MGNFSQDQKIRDLASPVKLVRRDALTSLGERGDRQAHRAIAAFVGQEDLEESLKNLAWNSLAKIEERLGIANPAAEPPIVSGRFSRPPVAVVPPPLIPIKNKDSGEVKVTFDKVDPGKSSEKPPVEAVLEDFPKPEAQIANGELSRPPTDKFDPRLVLGFLGENDQVRRAQLIENALEGLDKSVEPRNYGYRVMIPLLGGRKQYVRIAYERSDFEDDKLIVIYTRCGPARPDLFQWALELNRKLDHGKLAIGMDTDGQECFILMQNLLEHSATSEEMRKAVLSIAEKGDRIEKLLTDTDIH